MLSRHSSRNTYLDNCFRSSQAISGSPQEFILAVPGISPEYHVDWLNYSKIPSRMSTEFTSRNHQGVIQQWCMVFSRISLKFSRFSRKIPKEAPRIYCDDRRVPQKDLRKSLGNSSSKSLAIPLGDPRVFVQVFLGNFSRRSSENVPGDPRELLQGILGNYSRRSSWILQKKLANSSWRSSGIPPGDPQDFLRKFLGKSSRSASGIPA